MLHELCEILEQMALLQPRDIRTTMAEFRPQLEKFGEGGVTEAK